MLIWDEARSLDARGFCSLEEIDHSLSLESLQLGVDTDERPRPSYSITAVREKSKARIAWSDSGGLAGRKSLRVGSVYTLHLAKKKGVRTR